MTFNIIPVMVNCNSSWFFYSVVFSVLLIFPFFISLDRTPAKLHELERFIKEEFPITFPVLLQFGDEGFNFPDLVPSVQKQVNSELNELTSKNVQVRLIDNLQNGTTLNKKDVFTVELLHSTDNSAALDSIELKAYVYYTLKSIHSNDLPYYITQVILFHLLQPELTLYSRFSGKDTMDQMIINLLFNDSSSYKNSQRTINGLTEHVQQYNPILNISIVPTILDFRDLHKYKKKCNELTYFLHDSNELDIPNSEIIMIESSNFSNIELAISRDLWEALEIPGNPSCNIHLRIVALTRFKTLEYLVRNIGSTGLYNNQNNLKGEICEISRTIEDLSKIKVIDWMNYLNKLRSMMPST